ncbi:MAG: GH13_26 / GH13 [uncultured Solirubrobacteraceae bacterium]|uniref:GH13_26 / GH13 n=1 Tax=uncultured Solirubrobacteraceae bacterium TaxID=1162706 RepID=A0A6J4RHG5_9ACTN|nr:MAG: GH13_26 / GH13 [uncultured Solirubrobacteraceae bacterium]
MSDLRATYRLQLSPDLDFRAAAELVPYFRELGVSHLYLSPSLQARTGSTHGYDVVDPTRISAELGGEEAFRALAGAGLGVILDIVPNHMGAADENRWWADEERRGEVFDIDSETGFARRFFDIDDLVALRMEREDVFRFSHEKVLGLVEEGLVDGLRVDHPDGLADPAGYLRRLHDAGARHVWVEKILHPGEPLRDWPVEGTVGYEFLNDAAALYVDRGGERALSALWAELTGDDRAFEAVALEAQLEQAETVFHREIAWLERLAGGRFDAHLIAEALARLPVYRTYVEPWSGLVDDEDRRRVGEARLPAELARVLLLEDGRGELDEFVTRFQQTSPPVTAKGTEDTAFYRYLRMVALNEVGGDPGRFGLSVADFHAACAGRAARTPLGLLVTQTHDTKRSGDARARIGALAGMAEEWEAFVREQVDPGGGIPAAEQLLVLQTLVGVGEISRERLDGYLEKALREGKTTSNWIEPDEAHERAVQEWAWARRSDPAVQAFVAQVAEEGERAALGQLLLKLTTPGIPDVYQGDELWDLSLVDPDNRRPVDWSARREALAAVKAGAAPTRETLKLHLIHRALELRGRRPEAFGREGAYRPLEAGEEVCAFVRGSEVLVVAPLRAGTSAALAVPEDLRGAWRDVLTGASVSLGASAPVEDLLAEGFGLALLERA